VIQLDKREVLDGLFGCWDEIDELLAGARTEEEIVGPGGVLARLKPEGDPATEKTLDCLGGLRDARVGVGARGRGKLRAQVRIGLVLDLACVGGDSRGELCV